MTTPYQRLTRLREQVMALRGKLPVSSADAGELLTEFVDLIDTALLNVVKPDAEETDEEDTKELVMPERIDMDAFILDLWSPRNQMSVICS